MKKQKQKQIITIDEFDNTVSLYQLLPCGAGSGLKRLKIIIDSIHNSEIDNGLDCSLQENKQLEFMLVLLLEQWA
jgi:hypothetical protein